MTGRAPTKNKKMLLFWKKNAASIDKKHVNTTRNTAAAVFVTAVSYPTH
jgi:hypothetical protein